MQFAGRASVLLLAGVLLAPEAAQAFTMRQPMKMAATATKAGATSEGKKVEEPLLLRAARGEVRFFLGREGRTEGVEVDIGSSNCNPSILGYVGGECGMEEWYDQRNHLAGLGCELRQALSHALPAWLFSPTLPILSACLPART
jgi:hypothetical protein